MPKNRQKEIKISHKFIKKPELPVSTPSGNPVAGTDKAPRYPLATSHRESELRDALRQRRIQTRGRIRKDLESVPRTTDDYSRATSIVNTHKMNQLREIAFRETLTIKEVIENAFDLAIDDYEAKHGPLVPQPEKWGSPMTRQRKK